MKTINIQTESKSSRIIIGDSLKNLPAYLPDGKSIIITDEKVGKLYGTSFPKLPVITIGQGEKIKTLETLDFIFEKLVEYEADRSTFIVAIGGGIVCDVAGFAASVYMRGLRYGFVSTTLLSQVDASVGGKNGVNFRGYKNMIGVFNQPEFVMIDLSMLQTMDDREFRSGFSEIIKAAAIWDESLFSYIEGHCQLALEKEPSVLEKLVYDAIVIKSKVVETDEKERGLRKILNFGHTFAHALEHSTGMLHGEAVSIGMVLAAGLSVKLGVLGQNDQERLTAILRNFGLPVYTDVDFQSLVKDTRKDKKREGDEIHMILLNKIGESLIKKISFNQLEKLSYDLCQYSRERH